MNYFIHLKMPSLSYKRLPQVCEDFFFDGCILFEFL